MQLLKDHPFHLISITAITKVAGVSRAAFYRNYTSKEDILAVYFKGHFQTLLTQLEALADHEKIDRIRLFFTFFKADRELIMQLVNADLTPILYAQFVDAMQYFFETETDKLADATLEANYLTPFIASGLFSVLLKWLKTGTTENIEEMAQLMLAFTGR